MKEVYIHYGADHFDKTLFKPVKNQPYLWTKPEGGTGFWACSKNDKYGWVEWCQDNDFKADDYYDKHFEFTLTDDARVIYIYTLEDLHMLPIITNEIGMEYVDFEKAAEDYDAIQVCDVDAVYLNPGGLDLYGWDCNCILIMNAEIVEEV